jgi:hypothetical protein
MTNNQSTQDQEYFTLKDIILLILDYINTIKARWLWLLIPGVLIGGLYAYTDWSTPKMYQEKLTFMMDEKSGEAVEGLSLISDLFGGKSGDENLDKILRLFESKKIIHNTLFDTISLAGKNDYLANHIIDQYTIEALTETYKGLLGWKVYWPKTLNDNQEFRFARKDVEEFTNKENLYLRLLYEKIAGNEVFGIDPLLTSELDDDTGIMTLRMKSEYEDITMGILNNIYKQLSEFFIEKTVEKQKKTYDIIKAKKDSVITELTKSEYSLADFKDRNRNLVTVKGYLRQLQLERDVAILNVMYAEVVKQMEATDFALKNKTPVVQIIDLPRRPIIPNKPFWVRGFIVGFLLGVGIAIVFIVFRKFFTDILND